MFFWCSFNESDSTLVILGVPLPQHRPGWFRSPDLMVHNARKLRPNWPNLFCWSRGNWSAPNSPNWRLSTDINGRVLSKAEPSVSTSTSISGFIFGDPGGEASNFRPYMSLPFSHLPWSKHGIWEWSSHNHWFLMLGDSWYKVFIYTYI